MLISLIDLVEGGPSVAESDAIGGASGVGREEVEAAPEDAEDGSNVVQQVGNSIGSARVVVEGGDDGTHAGNDDGNGEDASRQRNGH